MEMLGRTSSKSFFVDAGDGAMATFHQELMELKRSTRRCQRILAGVLSLLAFILLVLIIVVGVQAKTITRLKQREGLIPHPNVTFASYSGDQSVNGLSYGGSLFRGSGFWSQKAILPGGLTDHAAIAVNEQVYIIGGLDQSGNVSGKVWLYDSIFHNYTAMQPMPQPRYRFGAALDSIGNKIYVVGGRVNDSGPEGCVNATFIYDIPSNVWTIGADILEGQSDPAAASLFGKVYLVGGYSPNYGYLSTIEIYDIKTDKWTYGPPMPTARGDLMVAAFDGEVYAIGGYINDIRNSSDMNAFTAVVESFNPNKSVWTTQPPMLTPRGDGAITVLPGDRLMVVGGEGHYDNDMDFKYPKHVNEIYYGADRTWVEKAMIPTARFRTAAATAGGLAFVFGGADICILETPTGLCPALNTTEVFLDVDHPHVYIYLKDDAYNDNAALTTYPS